jgi:hypothetical protein
MSHLLDGVEAREGHWRAHLVRHAPLRLLFARELLLGLAQLRFLRRGLVEQLACEERHSRNCRSSPSRGVDSLTATSTASLRRAVAKTPSPRPRSLTRPDGPDSARNSSKSEKKPATTSYDGHESHRWREGVSIQRDAEIAPPFNNLFSMPLSFAANALFRCDAFFRSVSCRTKSARRRSRSSSVAAWRSNSAASWRSARSLISSFLRSASAWTCVASTCRAPHAVGATLSP